MNDDRMTHWRNLAVGHPFIDHPFIDHPFIDHPLIRHPFIRPFIDQSQW
jgi:hypothetical protein